MHHAAIVQVLTQPTCGEEGSGYQSGWSLVRTEGAEGANEGGGGVSGADEGGGGVSGVLLANRERPQRCVSFYILEARLSLPLLVVTRGLCIGQAAIKTHQSYNS